MNQRLFCCECQKDVEAENVSGNTIYPHRPDLAAKRFFRCPHCGEYVGTHPDGRPLGTIPTQELRILRYRIHLALDALWIGKKGARWKRSKYYRKIAKHFDLEEYYTGEISSVPFGEAVLSFVEKLHNQKTTQSK